jgi:hypothetical protein
MPVSGIFIHLPHGQGPGAGHRHGQGPGQAHGHRYGQAQRETWTGIRTGTGQWIDKKSDSDRGW